MEIVKELKDISLQITEPEYRQMPELSYSTLSTYETLGFTGLDHLFDRKESPSLLLGSCVDAILTGGEDEFNSLYYVADIPSLGDKPLLIANYLFENYNGLYSSMEDIPSTYILEAANTYDYQKRWRDDNRIKDITEKCSQYYNAKRAALGKTVVDSTMFEDVKACVRALKESPATCGYFADDDEMSPVRRYYQLKFKATFEGVGYRNMAD